MSGNAYFDFVLLLVSRPDYTVRLGRPSLRPPILAFIILSLFGNKVFSIQTTSGAPGQSGCVSLGVMTGGAQLQFAPGCLVRATAT